MIRSFPRKRETSAKYAEVDVTGTVEPLAKRRNDHLAWIADADDLCLRDFEQRLQIERQMPVRCPDDRDAHGPVFRMSSGSPQPPDRIGVRFPPLNLIE
jgi:hypothetical protein